MAIAGDFSFFGASILALLAAIFFSSGRNTDAWQMRTFVFLRTLAHSISFRHFQSHDVASRTGELQIEPPKFLVLRRHLAWALNL